MIKHIIILITTSLQYNISHQLHELKKTHNKFITSAKVNKIKQQQTNEMVVFYFFAHTHILYTEYSIFYITFQLSYESILIMLFIE